MTDLATRRPNSRLLIIGADDSVTASAIAPLEAAGFEVLKSPPTSDWAGLLDEQNFDLVLLDGDSRIPGSTAVLKQLREQYSTAELPILVGLPSSTAEDIITVLRHGANDCIDRFSPPDLLIARVNTYVNLKRSADEMEATAASHSRLQRKLEFDLQAAARIQQNQMPAEDLFIDGWEVAWQSVPCETLGGDSLNVIQLDDENWAFYVLDVSGHGVPASLLAVSVSRILTPGRDGSGRHDTLLPPRPLGDGRGNQESPSVASAVYVLERLQEKFVPEEHSVQYFTIVYATLNSRTGEMRIASGGHPSPILMRAEQPPALLTDPDGPAIGLIPLDADIPFHEAELKLAPGDTLLLFSDGVIEAFDPQQRLFGIERLQRGLQGQADRPLREAIENLNAQVDAWRDGYPRQDDESILAIRRIE